MSYGTERELRILESRVFQLPVDSLEQRVTALEQQVTKLWETQRGGCIITYLFTVTDSSTLAAIAGATVELLDSGSTVLTSGTTDANGKLTLIVFADTVASYTATASGYTSVSNSLSGTCGSTVTTDVSMVSTVTTCTTYFTLNVTVSGGATGYAACSIVDHVTSTVYWSGNVYCSGGSGAVASSFTSPSGGAIDVKGVLGTKSGVIHTFNYCNTAPYFLTLT